MYVVRDTFHLKFAHYKDVKALLDEAIKMGMFDNEHNVRMFTDFTGDAYRLILEQSYKDLTIYEQSMGNLGRPEFQQWYGKFKEHVNSSQREILKQIK